MSRATTSKRHVLARTAAAVLLIAATASFGLVGAGAASAADVFSPPVAVPDEYFMTQDTVLSVPAPGLLANDTDPNATGLTVANVYQSNFPTELSKGIDGSFSYTPAPGFVGDRTFNYVAESAGLPSAFTTVTIHVAPAPVIPLAGSPDFYTTPMNTPFSTVGGVDHLLMNDANASYVTEIDDISGDISVNIYGDLDFIPPTDFVGTRTFSYRMDDGTKQSDWILVTIEVTAPATTSSTVPNGSTGTTGTTGVTADSTPGELAYTGPVTGWLFAPAILLVTAGVGAMVLATRRRASVLLRPAFL